MAAVVQGCLINPMLLPILNIRVGSFSEGIVQNLPLLGGGCWFLWIKTLVVIGRKMLFYSPMYVFEYPFTGLISQNMRFTHGYAPPRSSLVWLLLSVLRNRFSRLEMAMYLLSVVATSGGFGYYGGVVRCSPKIIVVLIPVD